MNKEEVEQQIQNELHRLVKPSFIKEWYNLKIPALNFRTPRELIDQGGGLEVLEMIKQIDGGIYG